MDWLFRRLAGDASYLATRVCDVLLIASAIFVLVYGLYMVWRAFLPAGWQPGHSFRRAAMPVLLLASLGLSFTVAGQIAADAWRGGWETLLGTAAEEYIPHVPVTIWVSGVMVALFILFRDFARLGTALSRCGVREADPAFQAACAAMGMAGRVALKSVPGCAGAGSWGLWRKCVAVPVGFLGEYAEEERYCIYLHELAHLRRHDMVMHLMLRAAKILFWFHPLVAWAARNTVDEIELACDRVALAQRGVEPFRYAELIVRAGAGGFSLPASFSAGFDALRDRVVQAVDGGVPATVGKKRIIPYIVCMAILVAAVVPLRMKGRVTEKADVPAEKIHALPDGRKVKLVFTGVWHGSLGSYCSAKGIPVSESEKTD